MKDSLRPFVSFVSNALHAIGHRVSVLRTAEVLIDDYVQRHLFGSPKYQDDKKLNKYEQQIFSQSGEDGIIREIFRRIGTTNKFFVEFGVGDGLENNTVALLLDEWQGAWIDGNATQVETLSRSLAQPIEQGRLKVRNAYVSAENIENHFRDLDVPSEPDLLSIDIDGNDYWVWQAISAYRPRVVVAEYNGHYGADIAWVQKYNPEHRWTGSSYFGVSLRALELLAQKKGYKLVGCNFMGMNAFFVRDDLVGDHFLPPFTAAHHFEPVRYFLYRRNGHPRQFGPYEIVK